MSCGNIQNQWKSLPVTEKYPLSSKLPVFCNKRPNCGTCANEVLTVENANSKHSRHGGRRRRRRRSRKKRGGEGKGWKTLKNMQWGKMVGVVEELMKNKGVQDELKCDQIIDMISNDENIEKIKLDLQNEAANDDKDAEILLSGINRYQIGELTDKEEQKEVCDVLIKYMSGEGGRRRRRRKKSTKKKKRRRRRKSTKKKKRRRRRKSRK